MSRLTYLVQHEVYLGLQNIERQNLSPLNHLQNFIVWNIR